jgi:hypothetical protein
MTGLVDRRSETRPQRRSLRAARSVVELALVAVAVLCGTLLCGTLPAAAQRTTAVTIRGVVSSVSRLTVVAQPASQNLDLEGGVSRVQVASVTERSNEPTGYTVTVASANARADNLAEPTLSGAEAASNRIPYAIAYGLPGQETPVSMVNGVATVTRATAKTSASGIGKSVVVTVPKASYPPDKYTDTLVFTVAAN